MQVFLGFSIGFTNFFSLQMKNSMDITVPSQYTSMNIDSIYGQDTFTATAGQDTFITSREYDDSESISITINGGAPPGGYPYTTNADKVTIVLDDPALVGDIVVITYLVPGGAYKTSRTYFLTEPLVDTYIAWLDSSTRSTIYEIDFIKYEVPTVVVRFISLRIDYVGTITIDVKRASTGDSILSAPITLTSDVVDSELLNFNEVEDTDLYLSYDDGGSVENGRMINYTFSKEDILK
jgi:hypothetical protein